MKIVSSSWLLISVMILFFIVSCSKNSSETNNCTTQLKPVFINFNVLDKTTNQDMYFSSNPSFQLKDIYFFRNGDVARKDTIRPIVIGTTSSRSFQYTCQYVSQDSIILKIGNLPDNKLTYTIKKTNDVCPNYYVSAVSFNGSALASSSDKYFFLK